MDVNRKIFEDNMEKYKDPAMYDLQYENYLKDLPLLLEWASKFHLGTVLFTPTSKIQLRAQIELPAQRLIIHWQVSLLDIPLGITGHSEAVRLRHARFVAPPCYLDGSPKTLAYSSLVQSDK